MNKTENINLEPINLSILNVMQFIKNGCYIKILHYSLEKSTLCSQFILKFEIKVNAGSWKRNYSKSQELESKSF